ncbi:MAG: transcriptional regulator [Rickettsiaceae bacterium]|jgi:DNA-binding transcriptional regulator YiaG|nr:transcriptional regulator [Rickettsiaceae bacterium]
MKNSYLLNRDDYLIKSGLIKEKMTPQRIKDIRKSFGLTQVRFSELLGLNYDTLRSWEGGYRYPSSPGYALLLIAEKSPQAIIKYREHILSYVKSNFSKT